jgi:hypothetical protein
MMHCALQSCLKLIRIRIKLINEDVNTSKDKAITGIPSSTQPPEPRCRCTEILHNPMGKCHVDLEYENPAYQTSHSTTLPISRWAHIYIFHLGPFRLYYGDVLCSSFSLHSETVAEGELFSSGVNNIRFKKLDRKIISFIIFIR